MKQHEMLAGLLIFKKYGSVDECNWGHDVFYASGVMPYKMTTRDLKQLDNMDWNWDEEFDAWGHFN